MWRDLKDPALAELPAIEVRIFASKISFLSGSLCCIGQHTLHGSTKDFSQAKLPSIAIRESPARAVDSIDPRRRPRVCLRLRQALPLAYAVTLDSAEL